MALTPTVLIATSGMMNGQGIGPNSSTSDKISSTLSNPLIVAYQKVSTNANVGDVAGLTDTLNSLPSSFGSVQGVTSQITAQVSKMIPNLPTFLTLHSGASAFTGSGMEFGAALSKFGNKSFGDMGIGVKDFTDITSCGMTSITGGLHQLADKAKFDAFGGIGKNLDPTALLKGQAVMASSALGDGLKSVGQGMKNFGSLFDFKNPQSMGYNGLVTSLQKEGLADTVGINNSISDYGYDPSKLDAVPDSVLKDVLSNVRGTDLQKIITQMKVKRVGTFESAADLVDPTKTMPAGAIAALGLKPGAGVEGLKSLTNTITNIGIPLNNVSTGALLGGIQARVGPYLSQLTTLVPQSVKSVLGSSLGSGSSPFGTPTMKDLLGSASGAHNTDLKDINNKFASLSDSSVGQALVIAMNDMDTALTDASGTAAAYTNLQTAVTNFNTQASSNSNMMFALAGIGAGLLAITSRVSRETSNFALSGINLSSPPTNPTGSAQVMAFADKLHSYGVDKLQLGHSEVLDGAATDDLTGDAIRASLLEGKNLAALQAAGKKPTIVSDVLEELAAANAATVDALVKDFVQAKQAEQEAMNELIPPAEATSNYVSWKPKYPSTANLAIAANNFSESYTTSVIAENNLRAAATSAGGNALTKADDAIAQFIK